jgi:Flp pilus assembly CpaF family ATPase
MGRHELTNLMLTTAQVQEPVERMLKSSGRRIDVSQPFVDTFRSPQIGWMRRLSSTYRSPG